MNRVKRATLDSALHRALRAKAAATENSVSDLVNAPVRHSLSEDAADAANFAARARAPALPCEDGQKDLKHRRKP